MKQPIRWFAVAALTGTLTAFAQTPDTQPPAASPAVPAADAQANAQKDLTTLEFPETEIRDILRNVADLFDLNLVVPDTLQGKTSIKLRNVSWKQIFNVVLTPVGFTYIEDGNIIKVVSRDSLITEPVRTEVLSLEFAKADELKKILDPMLNDKAGERLQIDPRSNTLLLTLGQSKSKEIRDIIKRLDTYPGDSRQILIDSKFLEINQNDGKDVGLDWSMLGNFTALQSYGYKPNTSSSGVPVNTPAVLETTPAALYSHIGQGWDKISSAVFSTGQFNLILKALQTSSNVKLVSNPTVVSQTNEEAKIDVITKFPVILTTSTPGASGPTITETREYEEYGIRLKVTPQIRPQSMISLSITPEVSNLDGFNIGGASRNQYPIVSKRTVTNRVNVKDGYTIALGGLIQSQQTKGGNKVPVLGSIPVIGRAFRTDTTKEVSRNLIVFLTARIIDGAGNFSSATQDNFDRLVPETADPRNMRDMGVKREDLPGYRPQVDPYSGTSPTERDGN